MEKGVARTQGTRRSGRLPAARDLAVVGRIVPVELVRAVALAAVRVLEDGGRPPRRELRARHVDWAARVEPVRELAPAAVAGQADRDEVAVARRALAAAARVVERVSAVWLRFVRPAEAGCAAVVAVRGALRRLARREPAAVGRRRVGAGDRARGEEQVDLGGGPLPPLRNPSALFANPLVAVEQIRPPNGVGHRLGVGLVVSAPPRRRRRRRRRRWTLLHLLVENARFRRRRRRRCRRRRRRSGCVRLPQPRRRRRSGRVRVPQPSVAVSWGAVRAARLLAVAVHAGHIQGARHGIFEQPAIPRRIALLSIRGGGPAKLVGSALIFIGAPPSALGLGLAPLVVEGAAALGLGRARAVHVDLEPRGRRASHPRGGGGQNEGPHVES
mmetsp:Transcript_15709/g.50763  ORF Transcript_15709/g.50763 Transcript_15709/m.50763 type:complete len:386 (+) Transcript_15709:217-1374(+)